jgi:hypothetical protein
MRPFPVTTGSTNRDLSADHWWRLGRQAKGWWCDFLTVQRCHPFNEATADASLAMKEKGGLSVAPKI